jgi:glutaredoxin
MRWRRLVEVQVDSQSRKLLEAFEPIPEGPGPASIGLADFGDPRLWRAVAQELVVRGWLRAAAQPDRYERTEDGRLALAKPLDVTLYTRPGCHLCEEAKAQIAPLLRTAGARLREVKIDADPALRALYDYDVPVILLGARKVAKHRVDLEQFGRQLAEAVRSAQAASG